MSLIPAQKSAIEEVINVLTTTPVPRGKRRLAEMFMDLVDKDEWPEYYEVSLFLFDIYVSPILTYYSRLFQTLNVSTPYVLILQITRTKTLKTFITISSSFSLMLCIITKKIARSRKMPTP
jgi:hypothetical protein